MKFQFAKDFPPAPLPDARENGTSWFDNGGWDATLLMDSRPLREAGTLPPVHPETVQRDHATSESHADYLYRRAGDDPFDTVYDDGGEG
jgi:hypothetical protein